MVWTLLFRNAVVLLLRKLLLCWVRNVGTEEVQRIFIRKIIRACLRWHLHSLNSVLILQIEEAGPLTVVRSMETTCEMNATEWLTYYCGTLPVKRKASGRLAPKDSYPLASIPCEVSHTRLGSTVKISLVVRIHSLQSVESLHKQTYLEVRWARLSKRLFSAFWSYIHHVRWISLFLQVRQLDWVQRAWPREHTEENGASSVDRIVLAVKPVRMFLTMATAGAKTEPRPEISGASAWIHLVEGEVVSNFVNHSFLANCWLNPFNNRRSSCLFRPRRRILISSAKDPLKLRCLTLKAMTWTWPSAQWLSALEAHCSCRQAGFVPAWPFKTPLSFMVLSCTRLGSNPTLRSSNMKSCKTLVSKPSYLLVCSNPSCALLFYSVV